MQQKKRKAKAVPSSAAKEHQGGGLFSGCHVVWWQRGHMQQMMERVRQLGGEVEDSLGARTTHVICRRDMPVRDLADRLAGCPKGRRCTEFVAGDGTVVKVPQGVAFVSPDFIAQSILQRELQPERDYLPAALMPATHPPAAQQAQQPAAAEAEEAGAGDMGQEGTVANPRSSGSVTPLAPSEPEAAIQPRRGTAGLRSSVAIAAAAAAEAAAAAASEPAAAAAAPTGDVGQEGRGEPCRVERRGPEFVCVWGAKPQFTGGHTGIPWGSFGVWDEPYDEAAARDTVEKVRSFWYHTQLPAGGVTQEPAPRGGQPGNGACMHAACSRRPFCLVQKLDEVKRLYAPGKDHHYRIKALDRGMHQLAQHPRPLDSGADVDALRLGEKTAEKVKQILARGSHMRVEAAAQDKRRQVISAFSDVWGAGPSTAARWYDAGCRSLEDVMARGDLTEQQRVGLRYHEDIQRPIPRGETAAAEAVARAAVFELCEGWGAWDVDRCFAQATGSYCRGKPESSDLDILVCLPPSLTGQDCGRFLTELLGKLLAVGLLLDELGPTRPHKPSTVRASWMGMARPPGSNMCRRIDVKVYAHELTPFAVNYFANSMSFCRATRHWANRNCPEAARRYNQEANGFKLSDQGMWPMFRPVRSGGGAGGARAAHLSSGSDTEFAGERVLPGEVHVRSETDIFEIIGLANVPPSMRYFHNYE